jgi:hypothetical protein
MENKMVMNKFFRCKTILGIKLGKFDGSFFHSLLSETVVINFDKRTTEKNENLYEECKEFSGALISYLITDNKNKHFSVLLRRLSIP